MSSPRTERAGGFAEGARRHGAEIATNTRVTGIGVERGRVAGVETDKGSIETGIVVNAGGMFAAEIGRLAGVVVPVVLGVWAVTALRAESAYRLGLLIQLMFLLVGWHYVKQGFGVMSVLAARRGVRFTSGGVASSRSAILCGSRLSWMSASFTSRASWFRRIRV